MRNFWRPALLVVMLTMVAGCVHDPGSTGAGAPLSKFQKILQKNELVVGMTGKQPPLNAKDQEGQLIGLEHDDLARRIAEAMGVKVKFELMDFFELFPALESGRLDLIISGLTMTPAAQSENGLCRPVLRYRQIFSDQGRPHRQVPGTLRYRQPANHPDFSQRFHQPIFCRKNDPQGPDNPGQGLRRGRSPGSGRPSGRHGFADFLACVLAVIRHPNRGLSTSLKTFSFEPFGE